MPTPNTCVGGGGDLFFSFCHFVFVHLIVKKHERVHLYQKKGRVHMAYEYIQQLIQLSNF